MICQSMFYLLLLPIESAAATPPTAPAVPIAAVEAAPKPALKIISRPDMFPFIQNWYQLKKRVFCRLFASKCK